MKYHWKLILLLPINCSSGEILHENLIMAIERDKLPMERVFIKSDMQGARFILKSLNVLKGGRPNLACRRSIS